MPQYFNLPTAINSLPDKLHRGGVPVAVLFLKMLSSYAKRIFCVSFRRRNKAETVRKILSCREEIA